MPDAANTPITISKEARQRVAIAAAMLVRAWREIESGQYPPYSAAAEAIRRAVPPDLLEDFADALDRFAFPARVLWGAHHERERQKRLDEGQRRA